MRGYFNRIPRIALGILATCSAGAALVNLVVAFTRARTLYQLDYVEGCMLAAGNLILHGASPYPDPQQWPMVLNPYGPVAYGITALSLRIGGLSLLAPRLAVLASAIIATMFLCLLIWKFTSSRLIAVAFGIWYLTLAFVIPWTYLVRADFFAVVLAIAGLYVYFASPRLWWTAVVLLVAALFCKPTIVAPLAAIIADLVLQRQWRKAARIASFAAALGTTAVLALQIATKGRFWFHLMLTSTDRYSLAGWAREIRMPALDLIPLFMFCVAAVAIGWRGRRLSFPVIYAVFTTIATLTAGKAGAVSNHFLEWAAALLLCASVGYSELVPRAEGQRVFALLLTVTTLGMGYLAAQNNALSSSLDETHLKKLMAADHQLPNMGCEAAYAFIRQHPAREVLSEDVSAVAIADKVPFISDPFTYRQIVVERNFPQDTLLRSINSGSIPLVILSDVPTDPLIQVRWTPALLRAIDAHYHKVADFSSCSSEAGVAYEPD